MRAGVATSPGAPMRLLSDSNWSIESWRTSDPRPAACPSSPAATTTARWCSRTSEDGGGREEEGVCFFPALLPGEGVTYLLPPDPADESGLESMSTLVRCASATAARASAEESRASWFRLFSGDPSSEPGVRTANDPPCGVPNAPDAFRSAFLDPGPAFASTPVFEAAVPNVSPSRASSSSAAAVARGGSVAVAFAASSRSPTSRSHLCHAGAARSITSASASVASARDMFASPGASSATYMSPSRFPPRKPPHVNTRGPTPAVVCLHRRLAAAAASLAGAPTARTSVTDQPAAGPAEVFKTARDSESSTMLPPPSAPPLTCSRVPTKDTACW